MLKITVIGRGEDAGLLANALGCPVNKRRHDVGIRYGIRKLRHPRFKPFKIEINTDEAVSRASNKYYSMQTFDSIGLPVPKYSRDCKKLAFPMLGRDYYHSKGTDIVFINNAQDRHTHYLKDYYVQYIKPRNEYRVHVVGDKAINVAVKLNGDKKAICRNLSTGWVMNDSKNWQNLCTDLPNIAVKAIKALGLHFGAVDILLSEECNPYILEVNTAPGLIERRAILYANAIRELIARV